MYNDKGLVPEENDFVIPLGQAEVKRSGIDATIVATSSMVTVALAAADKLANEGLEIEIVDPRTLMPLDEETIFSSVRKTGYALVLDEAPQSYGATAEIAARIGEKAFDYLDAPVMRIGAADVPIPFSPPLEIPTIPGVEQVVRAIKDQRGN